MSSTKLIGTSQVHELNPRGLVFFDLDDEKYAMSQEHAALFIEGLQEALSAAPMMQPKEQST